MTYIANQQGNKIVHNQHNERNVTCHTHGTNSVRQITSSEVFVGALISISCGETELNDHNKIN